jgi:hypothetical protein
MIPNLPDHLIGIFQKSILPYKAAFDNVAISTESRGPGTRSTVRLTFHCGGLYVECSTTAAPLERSTIPLLLI